MKRVFSGPCFPTFGLDTEIYSAILQIGPSAGKSGPENFKCRHFQRSGCLIFIYSYREHMSQSHTSRSEYVRALNLSAIISTSHGIRVPRR